MAYLLVVDDDSAIREMLATLLRQEGHEIGEACDGVEALERVAERRPDLILLDLNMPGMHGWRFLDELYVRGLRDGIRVIVMTAHAELAPPGSFPRRLVVSKPFDFDGLLALITQVLSEEPRAIRRLTDRSASLIGLLDKMDTLMR